ncbi:DUF5074 domain-containing protein [Pedobacter foliorum]|uniref:DUF5074 domain-containing protein n=1 Tax=Pedobacter foliorum TaxID=2739058 RepID=UPI001564A8F4|nr:DUF5074 domain-containing protein [Pedobacter foliorum]NRF38151.1 hypothetical protein [Pedobacter foliorum]
MNYNKLLPCFLAGLMALTIASCKKDKVNSDEPEALMPKETVGVYMLCEGYMGQNNSTISYYDIKTKASEKDYFKKVNGYALGETANDLQRYGSKMYCVVSGLQGKKNSYLEVIDVATGKSLKRIPFFDASSEFMPRYVAFNKNKAYVSGYDGKISRIDTATLTIDSRVEVGGALEGLAVVNNKIYVTNSDHSIHPNGKKNVVSVVDLTTFAKIKDIEVIHNPVRIAAAGNGDLLVISWGNFSDILPGLTRINSTTDLATGNYEYSAGALAIGGNTAYLSLDWGASIKPFDVGTGILGKEFVTDGTITAGAYGITVNPVGNEVYIADGATDGKAYCFSAYGGKKFEFATGPLPQHAVFKYGY